jgi:hypothetical protein
MTEGSRPRAIRSRVPATGPQQKGQQNRQGDRDQKRLRTIKGGNNQYDIPEGDQRVRAFLALPEIRMT